MRGIGVLALVLGVAAVAEAGEFVFANGNRLAGDLANEVLMVSTGVDVLEIRPEQVGVLTRDELRLKDGRTIRGTLVGGRLRARTPLGELAINVDDLRAFRADGVTGDETAAPAASIAPAAPPAAAAPGPGWGPWAPSPPSDVPSPPAGAIPAPSEPSRGPVQVAEGAKAVEQGVELAARGVGRTVTDGAQRAESGMGEFSKAVKEMADRLHDGAKAFGEAIWEGIKSVGRALQL